MNHAITAIYDRSSRQTANPAIAAIAARGAPARPPLVGVRTDSACGGATEGKMRPDWRFPNFQQVREEGEHYLPDRRVDEDDEANAELTKTAWAYTRKLRDAQGLVDDALNLVGVLLEAMEHDADSRATQARTVLEMTVESLHKAHRLLDEQESLDLDR